MRAVFFIASLFFSVHVKAQLEDVIVETYYISDSADATDTTGGRILAEGSVTYRVYIDLSPGYKIKSIYGDANHALIIASDSVFFNNIITTQPAFFGYEINKAWFPDNPTVALDSWLTIGLAARTHEGILKSEDPDAASLLGGSKNYGGSAAIPEGILNNNDPAAGIPLTVADGLVTKSTAPLSWNNYGFIDQFSFPKTDTTVFGTVNQGSLFISNDAYLLQSNGTIGPTPDNKVLVAQLTTQGKISFELNLEIMDSAGVTVKYVARNGADSSSTNVKLFPLLKYPQECGCKDPDFLEYKASYSCEDPDACITPIVLGCMDTSACNYNPAANFSVPALCCYPGYCNDRDLSAVCPGISNYVSFIFYPNPAQQQLTLQVMAGENTNEVTYAVYNSFGRIVLEKNLGAVSGIIYEEVDVSGLEPGLHMIGLHTGGIFEHKTFIKN